MEATRLRNVIRALICNGLNLQNLMSCEESRPPLLPNGLIESAVNH